MLPKKCDVAIIGGGIIGVTTAMECAERGLSVVLVEKGRIAGEQSSRNWGWVRKTGRDPREVPLILEARKAWAGMNERIGEKTGFRICGIAFAAENEKKFAEYEKWLQSVSQYDIGAKLISGKDIASLIPHLEKPVAGALYTQDDARAEPSLAVPAMAKYLRGLGVSIIENCAARSFETSAGRISSLITEYGEIHCQAIVLAGGFWARRFLGNHHVNFPQLGVTNSVMRTKPFDGPSISLWNKDFAWRKRLDGGYTLAHGSVHVGDLTPDYFRQFFSFVHHTFSNDEAVRLRIGKRFIEEAKLARHWQPDAISPFEQVRVLDPVPFPHILRKAHRKMSEFAPIFAKAEIAESWAGMIDVTPDAVPVIDEVPGFPGLILSAGYSGHGFGIGPGAGKLTADLLMKTAPIVDPEPFRFSRFK